MEEVSLSAGISSAWILPEPSLCRDIGAVPPALGSAEAQLTQINQSHSISSISMNPRWPHQSRSQGFPTSDGHQPLAEARIMAWSISVSNWLLGQAPASSPFWELWEKKTNSKLLQFGQEEWAGAAHALNPSIKQHSGAKSLSEVSIPHQALEEQPPKALGDSVVLPATPS